MNSVLRQLAFAAGAILFLLALGLALLSGASIPVALFRATAVMAIGTIVVALFFKFFTSMVLDFVNEKVAEAKRQRAAAQQAAAQQAAAQQTAIPGGPRPPSK
jgi:hypothetical protein